MEIKGWILIVCETGHGALEPPWGSFNSCGFKKEGEAKVVFWCDHYPPQDLYIIKHPKLNYVVEVHESSKTKSPLSSLVAGPDRNCA